MRWFYNLVKYILRSIFSRPPSAPPPQIWGNVAPILKRSPELIIKKSQESMGVDCTNYYNFVVCGQSGVGKSSLINGVLCLNGDFACPVDETEATEEIRCKFNKEWPSLRLWDSPGAGTKRHPAATYFQDKKLYMFDAILILSSDRFMEVDFDILKSAHEFGTPCAFVRTKCDIGVKNRAKRDKINALEASQHLREDVTQNFHDGLQKAGLLDSSEGAPPKLFFISNEYFSSETEEQDAYSIYDIKTNSTDTSLSSMDEQALITFLVDAAKRRGSPHNNKNPASCPL